MVDTPIEQIELAISSDQSNNSTAQQQSIDQSDCKNDGNGAVNLASAKPSLRLDDSVINQSNQHSKDVTSLTHHSNQSIDNSNVRSLDNWNDRSITIVDPLKSSNELGASSIDPTINQPRDPSAVNQTIAVDEELLVPISDLMRYPSYDSSLGGLSTSEADIRLARDGLNEFEAAKPMPLWLAYFYQFANLLMMLLVVSSVVAYALKEYVEATAIMVVVLLNTNLAVFTERKADNALAALAALSNPVANVVRDGGEVKKVDSRHLAVGDIIQLHTGDVVPADVRVIQAHSLDINEMILTGESLPVRKHAAPTRADISKALTPPNTLLSGTNVQNGNGLAMVVATGGRTKLGEIARMVTENAGKPKATKTASGDATVIEKDPNVFQRAWRKLFSRQPAQTDMQKSVEKLGAALSSVAVVVCILVLVIGIARNHQNPDHPDEEVWLGMLLVAVSLAVSAIPEGLPLALTVTLSLGGQRLAKCNALVRRIAAVENLGTVNVICTDKTGTLTEGKMSVVQLAVGAQFYSTLGDHITPLTEDDVEEKIDEKVDVATVAVATVTAPAEVSRSKKSFIRNLFSSRTLQSSRSVQERPQSPPTDNPFAAQTVNDGKRNLDAAINAPYMRETLLLTRIATLCSNAKLIKDDRLHQATATGNPTEAAIVLLADKVGLHTEEALKQNPRILELPFSSQKKMMFTVHDLHPTDHISQILGKQQTLDGRLYLTCGKGSCDMLLPFCTKYFAGHESVELITDSHRATILRQMEDMASQALRVIAVVGKVTNEAPKTLSTIDEEKTGDDDEALWSQQQRNLVFLGLIGIADPPRLGVADAIDIARGAGIRTVMITGDFLITAKAIARNIRLMSKTLVHNNHAPGEQAVDCSVLRPNGEYLPVDQLDALVPNCIVFARAQPRDKLEIVHSLQRQNLICVMTGDGTNDSAALSAADVGVAMGSGSDVAKGASAIVLLDDKFPTIITAIREGRSIYANIQKFIVFLVATNSTQMALILFCIVAGLPVPMSPLQILAINIITDGLPALALSAMPSESDVMKAAPRNRADFVITGHLRWVCFFHALWLIIILPIVFVVTLYWSTGAILQDDILGLIDDDGESGSGCRVYDAPGWSRVFDSDCEAHGVRISRTAVFLTLALAENARPYTVRWLYHGFWHLLLSNIALLCASALSLACLFIIMFVPAVMGVFGTDNLPWYVWVFVLGCALFTVILDEIVKYFLYQRGIDHSKDKEQDVE